MQQDSKPFLHTRADGYTETPHGELAVVMRVRTGCDDTICWFRYKPSFNADTIRVEWNKGDTILLLPPEVVSGLLSAKYARLPLPQEIDAFLAGDLPETIEAAKAAAAMPAMDAAAVAESEAVAKANAEALAQAEAEAAAAAEAETAAVTAREAAEAAAKAEAEAAAAALALANAEQATEQAPETTPAAPPAPTVAKPATQVAPAPETAPAPAPVPAAPAAPATDPVVKQPPRKKS